MSDRVLNRPAVLVCILLSLTFVHLPHAALAAVNPRLALPQGTRVVPIDNNRLLFSEAFLECVSGSNGGNIVMPPPTTSATTILGATFELVVNNPSTCGGGHAHCLIANNPTGASGLTTIRLQCGSTSSPFLQFQSPAGAASRLVCRDATIYSYPAEGSQQGAPKYVTFRFPSDDADPLDVASVRIVESLSAVQFRSAGLDNTADSPYLYYCPDVATASPPMGTSAADLDAHQQSLISSQQCVSFHSATTRSTYTHLHGYFLMLRSALSIAVAGAPEGIVLTYRTFSSWSNCTGQITFRNTAANVLSSVSLADPPVIGLISPSPNNKLSDGTYGIVAGKGYIAFSLAHPNLGSSNAINSNLMFQVTPIDISPNSLLVCYVANPSEDSCFSSAWPQLPFTMSGMAGDAPLFLKMEAQSSYGPSRGTVEVRRIVADATTGDLLGFSEPLFITAMTLKVDSNPSVAFGPSALMNLVTLSGVESPLFDTSSPSTNRRGGWEDLLYPPLVSKINVVSAAAASALLGPTSISSNTPEICSVSASSGSSAVPSFSLTDPGQQVYVNSLTSGTCILSVTPTASSQSLPLAVTVGASTSTAVLTTSLATSASESTGLPPSTSTVQTTVTESSLQATPPPMEDAAGDEGGGASITLVVVIIIVAVAVLAALLLICVCRRRIKAWLWPEEKHLSHIGPGKGDDEDSDIENPAASLSRRPRAAPLPHPTDMPGSPSLIVLSPRQPNKRLQFSSPHYAITVPNAQNTRGATEDDDGWDVHTSLASPPEKPMLPIGLTLGPLFRESPGDVPQATTPEAALASALSTSLNTSYASPGLAALRLHNQSMNIPPDFKHFSSSPQGASLASPTSHVFAGNNSISIAASPLGRNRIANPMAGVASALRSPQSPQSLPLPPSSPLRQVRRVSLTTTVPPALALGATPESGSNVLATPAGQKRNSTDIDFSLDRQASSARVGGYGRSAQDAFDQMDASVKNTNLDRTVAPREGAGHSPGHSQMVGGGTDSPRRDHTQAPINYSHYPYPTSPGASMSFASGPFNSPPIQPIQPQQQQPRHQSQPQPPAPFNPNNLSHSSTSYRSSTHPSVLPHRVDPVTSEASEFSPPTSMKKPQK